MELACPAGFALSAVVMHWFIAPTTTFHLSVWPLSCSCFQLPEKSRKTPLLDFAPPSELGYVPGLRLTSIDRERSRHRKLLSWDLVPLQRFGSGASTQRGFTSAATHRPRRFSRPRRLTPPHPSRSLPQVTFLGFLPYRVLPRRAADLIAELGAPHDVSQRPPALGGGQVPDAAAPSGF